jgi:hypothetical protein
MKTAFFGFRWVTIITAALACAVPPGAARADVIVRTEGPVHERDEAALYPLDLEPHFSFGPQNVYGNSGFGGGLRLSIPLVGGHLGPMPENLAVSFGGDIPHYDNCFFPDNCGANYLMVPVAAQWNVFVIRGISVFGEVGAFLYKGWFTGCGPTDGPDCSAPSDFGLLPTLAIGGRVHFGSAVALTLRLGYPTTTLGLSFL